jgi:CubicO group peptidase (beta-lactamase class C family)
VWPGSGAPSHRYYQRSEHVGLEVQSGVIDHIRARVPVRALKSHNTPIRGRLLRNAGMMAPTMQRASSSLLALMLAASGCGGGEPIVGTAPPPVSASPSAAASAPPAAIEQTFAGAEPDVAFRDPDRRKKLAAAFPDIEAAVEDEVKAQKLPSVAVGVVIDGELAYSKGFGFADLKKQNKPDADTLYRIGSITKSFTALALLSLRDEGALNLDDALARWIPEAGKVVYPTRDSPPITLRQMLNHTSGLPRDSDFDFEHDTTEAQVLSSVSKTTLTFAPGVRFMYSNLGYVLLGLTVGRAAHTSVRDAVKKRILAPLGMTSTAYDIEDVDLNRLATPYQRGPNGPELAEHWKVGATAGAGALFSSVRDMARYVAMQLDAYPPRSAPDKGPIKRSSIREAHSSAQPTGLHVELAVAPAKGESLVAASAESYGYGWSAAQSCDFNDRVGHSGGMAGYVSDVTFFRDRGVGVVVLTNTAPANTDAIVRRIVAALRRSGGMSARSPALSASFDAAVKKLLGVYNTWDEAAYRGATRPPRDPREKEELEGYKKLHGTCTGYAPIEIVGPHVARLALQCERGPFEMLVQVTPDDALVGGFIGTTRDAPIPPELKKVADRVAGLIAKWDEETYKKHFLKMGRPRDATFKQFESLRAAHGSCMVKSSEIVAFDRSFVLECAQGTSLRLTLELDAKDPSSIASFGLRPREQGGICPVK